MNEDILNPGNGANVQVESIRRFMRDRDMDIDFNGIDVDLKFSDADIMDAIMYFVERYNATPPYDKILNFNRPIGSMMLRLGAGYELAQMRIRRLQEKDFSVNAGGIQLDNVKALLANLRAQAKEFYDQSAKMISDDKHGAHFTAILGVQVG